MNTIKNLDFCSIAEWFAIGFFLEKKSFYKNDSVPFLEFGPDIKWHYSPKNITFNDALDQYSILFNDIINKKSKGKKIILPISGGLDSRTIAAALKDHNNVIVISYEYLNGVEETKYAEEIAKTYDWEFHRFKIEKGYLWDKIDQISNINRCYSEFTHPRQMAIIDKINRFDGDLLILGHWGDVLFTLPQISENASLEEQSQFVINMVTKPGGIELATDLWEEWGLRGTFMESLYSSINNSLIKINIDHPQTRVRAFKSLNWARRWANPNLNIFKSNSDIFIPYYEKSICEFICSTPSKYLNNRRLQIEFLKNQAPELAKINWQEYDLNLYKYKYFNSIYLPKRIYKYFIRNLIAKRKIIQRNWELQFLGKSNLNNIESWLFETPELNTIIPTSIINDYYTRFKNIDKVKYSHCVSMLLTLAVWSKKFQKV